MKYGFLRVTAASPALKVADPAFNAARIIEKIRAEAEKGTEVLVFPELSLSGYTCGDLFLQEPLLDGCMAALRAVAEATEGKKMLVFVGLPVRCGGKLYNCAAGVSDGMVLGFVPKTHLPNYNEFYEARHFARGSRETAFASLWEGMSAPLTTDILFAATPEIAVACEICEDVWAGDAPSARHAQAGAAVVVNLSASNETVGKREYRKTILSAQSGRNVCAYVYCDAGVRESTSDMVFAGNHMIFENGAMLAEAAPFSGGDCTAEIDVGFLLAERRRLNTFGRADRDDLNYFTAEADFFTDAEPTLRAVSPLPFVPEEEGERKERAQLILNMQANALARRMAHTGAKTAVIGISGGLDSTLALLVTARAFDLLGKDRKNVFAYTMPGFGTTGKTKNNSLLLMDAMGVTSRTVPISETVLKHFADIGHDPAVLNATYENAQARYRTMILMDAANEAGGIVVGNARQTPRPRRSGAAWRKDGAHSPRYSCDGDLARTASARRGGQYRAKDGGHRRTVRTARLFPLPLCAPRRFSRKNALSCAEGVRGQIRPRDAQKMARELLPPLFLAAVQAQLRAGRREGRFGIPFPARRLAYAVGRVGGSVAGTGGKPLKLFKMIDLGGNIR